MTLVQGNGGLLVPQGALEAAVTRALRQHDDELRLVPQDSDVHGTRVYKVYRYNGPDRAADFVCGWWDERGTPYPLSMNLVELVQMHDRNTVGVPDDEDVHNRRLREERRRDSEREGQAIVQEFSKKIDGKSHTILPRSRSLQLARQKQRAAQPNPELRP